MCKFINVAIAKSSETTNLAISCINFSWIAEVQNRIDL